MPEFPKISIITPSFNQAQFIDRTIRSVIDQKYPNLEYMVFDGGSTDGTVEIFKKYGKSFFWVSEKDRGQSDALNKGIRKATGEIIGFINSDDTLAPDSLWKVAKFFSAHPDAQWVTGRCRTINEKDIEIRKFVTFYKNLWLRAKSYTGLMITNYVSQPATFWRRKIVEEVGLFDESLHYSMDYDYWLRIGKKFKINVIKDYLASFRIHSASKAGASANKAIDADFGILKNHTKNALLLFLHRIHNALIVFAYRNLIPGNHGLYSKDKS